MTMDRIKEKARRLADAVRQDKLFYLFALLTVLAAGTYVTIMHSRTLPFAEGWYTYYAKCIHEGLLPYRDFEYLYPPVYIYTVALITKIFGFDLIVLRRFGILIFSLIALGLYLSASVVTGKKRSWIALVAALTGVFYLQSEVVQTFYDYVRLMDAVAAFSLFFLLKSVKNMLSGADCRKTLITCGTLGALFINIKQNIGLIFFVYAFVLVLYVGLWCRVEKKQLLKNALYMLIPLLIVQAIVWIPLMISGSFKAYLSMTGLSAAGAKGGIVSILFGWLIHNGYAFGKAAVYGVLLVAAVVGIYLWKRLYLKDDGSVDTPERDSWIGIAFFALVVVGIAVITLWEGFAKWFCWPVFLSPYIIFLAVFPVFVACGVWGIVDMVHRRQTMRDAMLLFALAGAYFAIAFGCGNSGGLAEGQSSFGILFLVVALLTMLDRNWMRIARGAVVLVALLFLLQAADRKMVHTYNWWGMAESDYWASTESSDLALLRGIRLSAETKAAYEGICQAVRENTDPDDPIYCFPQIPLLYQLCDRKDPGVYAKVQWFDVASDQAVLSDIEVLKQNPPAAVVIFNTVDYAYFAHERSFRNGNVSGTRLMREFLHNYVVDNGYRFCGKFVSNGNSVSVWVADGLGDTRAKFESGRGTAEDPFVIATPEQLQLFSQLVNAGRSFDGQYILQSADIDMTGYDFTPIGEAESNTYFSGVYNGGGHVVKNIRIADPTKNIGFFGGLAGEVYNLGLEDCSFEGIICGGIAVSATDVAARIVNCYADVAISGQRVGGIAHDFVGSLENCISSGSLRGEEFTHATAYAVAKNMKNLFVSNDRLTPTSQTEEIDGRITAVSAAELNGEHVRNALNAFADEWNADPQHSIKLCHWTVGASGHPVFLH